ncbi:TatD family hydrolase [Desulfobacula sp.]|uniref:TatD family hydrolase n=1 Tax=Desulfobacula sp. TaxID=2593537 RepID=UPI0039B94F5F
MTKMKLFDSHSHIDDKCYDNDLKEIIERAKNENVCGIMIVGIDINRSFEAVKIASTYKNIITSVGIHPHDAKLCSKENLDTLTSIARDNLCVKAWGETGLDFNRMFSSVKDQESCFIRQLEIADILDLPLIFHERDSKGRFYDILKSKGPKTRKGVVHCFSGTKAELFKYLDLGYYIGITGILTLKKRGEYLRSIAPHIPEDRILIETDAPYLTPAPQKNKFRRNEPSFVKSVLIRLAEIRNEEPEVLSQAVYNNTRTLYKVDF